MLLRHSAIYVVAKLVPGLFGMLTTALLTRLFDPAQYGILGLAMVVMAFGANLAFDWLGLAFMRFYQARQDDPRVLPTFGWMFLGLVVLTSCAACLGWAAGAARGDKAEAVAVGLVLVWAYSWFELAARIQIANFRPGRYLLMNMGRALFTLVGAVGTAWATRDPILTGLGMAGGILAGESWAVLATCFRDAAGSIRLWPALSLSLGCRWL